MSQPNGDRPILNNRYEVHSRIGRGGMADVYLARDLQLDRPVAVKVLFPEYANDGNFVERFRREAQAAANLTHPNIVSIFDWGQQGSTYFIVMEYVNGQTLADIVRTDGQLDPIRAAEIADGVAGALTHAHSNGVIHRDVKPGNVLVGKDGSAKVTDFGIARAANASADEGLTQAGAVMGTAQYFSPEQALGESLDARSDLYSLGVVMYEMAAGRPAFTGDGPVSIAYKQVHEQAVPLSRIRADIPRGYQAIVEKLMQKQPGARYESGQAVRADLRRFLDGQSVRAETAATGAVAATTVMAKAQTAYGETQAIPATARTTGGQVVVRGGDGQPMTTGYAPYEEPPKRSNALLVGSLVLVIGAIGLLAFLLVRALQSDGNSDVAQVAVPNVVGQQQEAAQVLLEEARLVAVIEFVEEGPAGEAEGIVVAQDPAADSEADEGSEVTIQVVQPGDVEPVVLDDYTGRSATEVQAELDALDIVVSLQDEPSSEIRAGDVVRQDPAAGSEVIPGQDGVTLFVAVAPDQVVVPNVVGIEAADAVGQLVGLGLRQRRVTEASNTMGAGLVIRTEPAASTPVAPNTEVVIVVSSGAAPAVVPDVIGLSETDATTALQDVGLGRVVTFITVDAGSAEVGTVIAVSPGVGETAPVGSRVNISVGRAAATTTTTAPPTSTSTTAASTSSSSSSSTSTTGG
jgi:eukaryotic-like serine/threonine-protein kinase